MQYWRSSLISGHQVQVEVGGGHQSGDIEEVRDPTLQDGGTENAVASADALDHQVLLNDVDDLLDDEADVAERLEILNILKNISECFLS